MLFFSRDHPKTIRQRFRSVFVVSLLSPLYVWLWADGTSEHNVITPFVITIILVKLFNRFEMSTCYAICNENGYFSSCFSGTFPLEISRNTFGEYCYCSFISFNIDNGKRTFDMIHLFFIFYDSELKIN